MADFPESQVAVAATFLMRVHAHDHGSIGERPLPDDTSSVVDRLAVILHPERVAAIASVDERTVNAWIAGCGAPSPGSELALRLADQVVLALIDRLSPDAVYGWFGGENPLLGGRAPCACYPRGIRRSGYARSDS